MNRPKATLINPDASPSLPGTQGDRPPVICIADAIVTVTSIMPATVPAPKTMR